MFRKLTAEQERRFEQDHIRSIKDAYLKTDVLERISTDKGYRAKIELIRSALLRNSRGGWILDVGANTCGEAEILASQGFEVIASDVNEVALGLSQLRCSTFRRRPPEYLGGDAHSIPLGSSSIDFCLVFEALHHMADPGKVASEIARVLTPGGVAFLVEPYAGNPYRRLAEIRERLKGTIEKSFSMREIRALLLAAGLVVLTERRFVQPPSSWKNRTARPIKRWLREIYFQVSRSMPRIFGSLVIEAKKSGHSEQPAHQSFESMLRCPISGSAVSRVGSMFISEDPEARFLYPAHHGIPVLIASEAKQVSVDEWKTLRKTGGT